MRSEMNQPNKTGGCEFPGFNDTVSEYRIQSQNLLQELCNENDTIIKK